MHVLVLAWKEAKTSNHSTLLMMLMYDNVFDKYKDDSVSIRKRKQINTRAEAGQRRRANPKA
jgi:hypothetical protein